MNKTNYWAVYVKPRFYDYYNNPNHQFVLEPWGNGSQLQFPIFSTRKEAREWANKYPRRQDCCARIVKVRVEICDKAYDDYDLNSFSL